MEHDRKTVAGLGAIVAGVVLLLVLRIWTSPVARTVTGRDSISVVSFLGIPLLLGLVALGIGLLLADSSAGARRR